MAKNLGTLIFMLAFGTLFVILFVPGIASDRAQRSASLLFAMSLTAMTLFGWHIRTVKRVSGRSGRIAALAGPAALMILMWFAPRQREDWINVVAAMVGAYLLGIGIVWLIVRLTHRE